MAALSAQDCEVNTSVLDIITGIITKEKKVERDKESTANFHQRMLLQ